MTIWLEWLPDTQWKNKNLLCLFYEKKIISSLFGAQQRQISSSVLPFNLGEDFPASCIGWKIFQASLY